MLNFKDGICVIDEAEYKMSEVQFLTIWTWNTWMFASPDTMFWLEKHIAGEKQTKLFSDALNGVALTPFFVA